MKRNRSNTPRIIVQKPWMRAMALLLVVVFLNQICFPTAALALSGGPSAPEFGSFQQASASDMVDLFTGDFKYNIPLIEVDGYPINLSYTGNVGMEEEASWVGLGWNLTPGMINRTVRGIPDDFNGTEEITELNYRKSEVRMSFNLSFAGESAGKEGKFGQKLISALAGSNIDEWLTFNYSTSRGFSIGAEGGLSLYKSKKGPSVDLNLSYGAGSGININPSVTFAKQLDNDASNALSALRASIGYNSRSGLQNLSFRTIQDEKKEKEKDGKNSKLKFGQSSTSVGFPIVGTGSYFPHSRPTSSSLSFNFSGKIGVSATVLDGDISFRGSYYRDDIRQDEYKKISNAYGYYYLQNAHKDPGALLDFNQDGDVSTYYPGIEFLPPSALTYDLYNVTGQGFSGSIRPKRMETGAYSDPEVSSTSSFSSSLGFETAPGQIIKIGGDQGMSLQRMNVEPWEIADGKFGHFDENPYSSLEQNIVFMKGVQSGMVNESYFDDAGGLNPISFNVSSPYNGSAPSGLPSRDQYPSSDEFQRLPQQEVLTILTAKETKVAGLDKMIRSYTQDHAEGGWGSTEMDHSDIDWEETAEEVGYIDHHVTEITAHTSDGSRYVYGIPVRNISKQEVTFNNSEDYEVSRNNDYLNTYDSESIVIPSEVDDNSGPLNDQGNNRFYNYKETPTYTYAHLITGYLGADYVDVKNDGISDDDIGNAVKFNWTRTHSDYKWRSPMTGTPEEGRHMKGSNISDSDQNMNVVYGTKEIWYPHSIETKNHIAFFDISEREDGAQAASIDGGIDFDAKKLFQLDEIILYSKHEWNTSDDPTPIQTVHFDYDYSLCQGATNSEAASAGKLTLTKVYITYGESSEGELSPYLFEYNTNDDWVYNPVNTDRWGNYKNTNPSPFTVDESGEQGFMEYPYMTETKDASDYGSGCNALDLPDPASENDKVTAAWQLEKITLPTGGTISISYESDTYSWVEDKKAQMMYQIRGIGPDDSGSSTDVLHKRTPASSLNNMYLYVDNPYSSCSKGYIGSTEYNKHIAAGGSTDGSDLFDTDDWLYFKVPIEIPSLQAKNPDSEKNFDYVRGYCEVKEVGVCEDETLLYLKLEPVKFNNLGTQIHPILKSALDHTYSNHQNMVFGAIDADDSGILKMVKNITAIKDDLLSFFVGPYRTMLANGMCKTLKDDGSGLIRMNHPTGNKRGGGIRVKSVVMSDAWNLLSTKDGTEAGEAEATYGQNYFYDDPETGQSSGVASYEPGSGNDETPHKQPYFYSTNTSNSPKAKPLVYQEGPIGELFYPPGTVGYSYVRVENIHTDKKSTANYTEHEFYTAKDYPMQIQSTKIDEDIDENKPISLSELLGYGTSRKGAATAQGHSFVFNDMHGKPKATRSYAINFADGSDKFISSTEYIYHTESDGKTLSNDVRCVNRDGSKSTETIGLVTDIGIYSKKSDQYTYTQDAQSNLSTFLAGVFPATFPSVWPGLRDDHNEYRTAIVTKITQQTGLIKEVIHKNKYQETRVANELYDAQTGSVLLTSTNTEYHNDATIDKTYEANFPSYFAESHERMGHAYRNIGYKCIPDKSYTILQASSSSPTTGVKDLTEEQHKQLKEFIFKGYIDGLNSDNIEPYNDLLFGNQVPSGVFIEGDEVIAINPSDGTGDRYIASEVITKEQYDLINEMTSILKDDPNPLAVPPVNTVVTSTLGNSSAFTPVCGYQMIDDPLMMDAYTSIVGASEHSIAQSDISAVLSNLDNYSGDIATQIDVFFSELEDGMENNVSSYPHLEFGKLWSYANWGNDFFTYSKWMLTNPVMRHWLSTTYQNCSGAGHCDQVDALLTVLGCNDINTCLTEDVASDDMLDALDFLTNEYGSESSIMTLLSYLAFGYETQLVQINSSNLASQAAPICCSDLLANGCVNVTDNLVTYADLFTYHQTTSSGGPGYAPDLFNFSLSTSGYNLTPDGDYHYGFVENCEVLDKYDYLGHKIKWVTASACPPLVEFDDSHDYSNLGENPGINTTDPQDYAYNESPHSDLVMFVDVNGDPVDLEGFSVRIIRSGRRNMQSAQVGSTISLNTDPYGEAVYSQHTGQGYLQASATQYSDDWTSDFHRHDDLDENIHPFLGGYRGIFRPKETYIVRGERNAEDELDIMRNGLIEDFEPYWDWSSSGYNQIIPSDNTSHWVMSEEVISYSLTGLPAETENALDIPSTSIVGYQNQVMAVANNARHNEVFFEPFEYYLGHTNNLETANGYMDDGTSASYVTTEDQHSGKASKATNSTLWFIFPLSEGSDYDGPEYQSQGFNPEPGKEMVLSMWLKTREISGGYEPSDDIATVTIYYLDGAGGWSGTSQQFTKLGPMIDGWRRMEQIFTIPDGTAEIQMSVIPTDLDRGLLLDDFRIHPANSSMTTYVHNSTNGRLMTILDDNNYGTFYRYAPDGSLNKVERETLNGRITVKESVKRKADLNP